MKGTVKTKYSPEVMDCTTLSTRCSPLPLRAYSRTWEAWASTCPPRGFFGSACVRVDMSRSDGGRAPSGLDCAADSCLQCTTHHEHGTCSGVAHDGVCVQHCYVELLSNLQLRHSKALAIQSGRHLLIPKVSQQAAAKAGQYPHPRASSCLQSHWSGPSAVLNTRLLSAVSALGNQQVQTCLPLSQSPSKSC